MKPLPLIPAKTILGRTAHGEEWFGYDYTLNLYQGCSHGCIYCDSRSDCYRIENFDQVRAKADALELLDRELARKRKKGIIGTGAMSDPYNPYEGKHKLTRQALELIDRHGFGVQMLTKSALVTRDIDIYRRIASHSAACVKLTITTMDDKLCRQLEPQVSSSRQRLVALSELSQAGLFTGVLLTPLLPFINDTEENVAAIVEASAEAGARFVYPGFGVTLRQNQRLHYYRKLDELFPGMRERYIRRFGERYYCAIPQTAALTRTLASLCSRYGLLYKMPDIIAAARKKDPHEQLTLF